MQGGMNHQEQEEERQQQGRRDPDQNLKTFVKQLREWQTTVTPPYSNPIPPRTKGRYEEWFGDMQMHRRGFHGNDRLEQIENAIWHNGLDVILRMEPLPATPEEIAENDNHPFWNDERFSLFQIHTDPTPLFINMVASTYDEPRHFHISLCYNYQVLGWYRHIKGTHGSWRAWEYLLQWLQYYARLQATYSGKHARIYGRITNGRTVELNNWTWVEDCPEDHQLFDGGPIPPRNPNYPDPYAHIRPETLDNFDEVAEALGCKDKMLRFVHRLPGNPFSSGAKCNQSLHVSMLNDDDWDDSVPETPPDTPRES